MRFNMKALVGVLGWNRFWKRALGGQFVEVRVGGAEKVLKSCWDLVEVKARTRKIFILVLNGRSVRIHGKRHLDQNTEHRISETWKLNWDRHNQLHNLCQSRSTKEAKWRSSSAHSLWKWIWSANSPSISQNKTNQSTNKSDKAQFPWTPTRIHHLKLPFTEIKSDSRQPKGQSHHRWTYKINIQPQKMRQITKHKITTNTTHNTNTEQNQKKNHPTILHHSPTSDVLFLFIEIRSLNNFSHHHQIRQCLMICQHPMSFFSSSRSDHWTISLIIIKFDNVWWFVNIRCPFSLDRDQIIEQFLSSSSNSTMFDDLSTSDVLFLFIEIRSLNNFSYDDEIRQCLMICQHPMSFFSSSKSDHWTISLIMMRFVNVWWFVNIRCPFSLHRDQIIEQFLLAGWDSSMFDDLSTSDVLFLFIEIRSLNNFSHHHHIRQCLMICQHSMSFFSSSRSDHWTISLIMMRFVNVWWFVNIRCPFSLHRDQIIEQFLS